MKRINLVLLSALCSLPGFAQLNGDGFYRVQNVAQSRYINVVDNRGSINLQTTDADMAALRTVLGFEDIVSDPGSIIYFRKLTTGYDLQSQGTGSYGIINYEVKINDMGDGTYRCSASKSGMTKYLDDELIPNRASAMKKKYGQLVTNSPTTRDWYIKPIKDADEFYFGLKPTVACDGSYYQTFYASFPFTFLSEGMSAYYVSNVNEANGTVQLTEVTGGVPSATPVIIKCAATEPAKNKLNIGASTTGSATGNKLTGVYFCNPDAGSYHTNVVAYNASTMRVLGTAADGSLAFVKRTDLQYIPANTAYITVSATAPDVLKVSDGSQPAVQGDVNDDGVVDVDDVGVIARMILGIMDWNPVADLNGDGTIDVEDIAIAVKIMLNK